MRKNLFFVVLAMTLLFCFSGCATTAYMPLSQIQDPRDLGHITARFETNERIGIGFWGGTGLVLAGIGGYMLGAGIGSGNSEPMMIGGAMIGGGLGLAIIQDFLINRPRVSRINASAREALLIAARQVHQIEDVDVRDIRWTLIQSTRRVHLYEASGVVIQK